jgi:hypothetical protein
MLTPLFGLRSFDDVCYASREKIEERKDVLIG